MIDTVMQLSNRNKKLSEKVYLALFSLLKEEQVN